MMTVLGIMDGKRKHREASQRRKERERQEDSSPQQETINDSDEGVFPTWVANNDKFWEFVNSVIIKAKVQSVPEAFTLQLFQVIDTRIPLLLEAGRVEMQNGSFDSQQICITERVVKTYTDAHKEVCDWVDDELLSSADEFDKPPSWIHDNAECEKFVNAVILKAKIHSVPEAFTLQLFQVRDTRRLLLQTAGRSERQKCSIEYQQRYVTQRVVKMYSCTQRVGDWIDEALPSRVDKFNELENFMGFVQARTILNGVPVTYTKKLFQDEETRTMLLKLAWSQEFQDTEKSFLGDYSQRLKVVDKIVAMYNI